MKSPHVKDIDHGWRRIKRQLRLIDGSVTKVGLPEEGKTSGRGTGVKGGLSMQELIQVGAWAEFGDEKFKVKYGPRPFIRDTVDNKRNEIKVLQEQGLNAVYTGLLTARGALKNIGEAAVGMIKTGILSGNWTPNAPRTIRKKGFDKPLIESTQLYNSIQHKEEMHRVK